MGKDGERESSVTVLTEATLRQDVATALPNFFAFLQEAPEFLQVTAGIALLLDINGLQDINSRTGRQGGDAAVAALVRAIRGLVSRPILHQPPRCYRVGGDEFLLLLPGEQPEQAAQWIARLNAGIAVDGASDSEPAAATVRGAAVAYPTQPNTVAQLLIAVYQEAEAVAGCPGTGIVHHLLDRIGETLSLLVEARHEAYTDVISGLPNHRAAESALREALASAAQAFSVVLVDGDDLRAYNTISYHAGNQMIRDLGQVLGERLREGDLLARWLSGDEYLIILPGAGRRDAHAIADRLRAHVARGTASWPIPITVSVGVASAPEDGQTVDELIRRVEQRAILAKQSGKDRVA